MINKWKSSATRGTLTSDRETSRYVRRSPRDPIFQKNMHMLIQDVQTRILPYRRQRDDKEFKAILSSPNARVEEYICSLLSEGDYQRHDITESVVHFLRECSSRIIASGRAIYEIVHYKNKDDSDLSFVRLENVSSKNIKFILGTPFQILPGPSRDDSYGSADDKEKRPRFKKIKSDKILLFEIPAEYRKDYKSILFNLRFLEENETHNLKILERSTDSDKQKFLQRVNVLDYKMRNLAVLSATNGIGWDGRHSRSEYFQEYYTLVRFLKFERFKLKLRESILGMINKNLNRLISDSSYDGFIILQNLPTESDIDKAEQELKEGKKKFNDIIAPFLFS